MWLSVSIFVTWRAMNMLFLYMSVCMCKNSDFSAHFTSTQGNSRCYLRKTPQAISPFSLAFCNLNVHCSKKNPVVKPHVTLDQFYISRIQGVHVAICTSALCHDGH